MQGKSSHRGRSLRLPDYDYSQPGAYFVTMVTWRREPLLGRVVDAGVQLTTAGRIVADVWRRIPDRYPGVLLESFVVMPDHFHGIVVFEETAIPVGPIHELAQRELRQQDNESPEERRKRRRVMLLPRIIGYFKMNTAKAINSLAESSGTPVWQRDYFERVIRDEGEWERIRRYIEANPSNWLARQKGDS